MIGALTPATGVISIYLSLSLGFFLAPFNAAHAHGIVGVGPLNAGLHSEQTTKRWDSPPPSPIDEKPEL